MLLGDTLGLVLHLTWVDWLDHLASNVDRAFIINQAVVVCKRCANSFSLMVLGKLIHVKNFIIFPSFSNWLFSFLLGWTYFMLRVVVFNPLCVCSCTLRYNMLLGICCHCGAWTFASNEIALCKLQSVLFEMRTWKHLNTSCCILLFWLSRCTVNSLLLNCRPFANPLRTTHRRYTIFALLSALGDVWWPLLFFFGNTFPAIWLRLILKHLFIIRTALHLLIGRKVKRSTNTAIVVEGITYRSALLQDFTLTA